LVQMEKTRTFPPFQTFPLASSNPPCRVLVILVGVVILFIERVDLSPLDFLLEGLGVRFAEKFFPLPKLFFIYALFCFGCFFFFLLPRYDQRSNFKQGVRPTPFFSLMSFDPKNYGCYVVCWSPPFLYQRLTPLPATKLDLWGTTLPLGHPCFLNFFRSRKVFDPNWLDLSRIFFFGPLVGLWINFPAKRQDFPPPYPPSWTPLKLWDIELKGLFFGGLPRRHVFFLRPHDPFFHG